MQSISPQYMVNLAIGAFMESKEVVQIISMPEDSFFDQQESINFIETLYKKASELESFITQIEQVTSTLAEKHLTPQLRLSGTDLNFQKNITSQIKSCLFSAYGILLKSQHVGPAYFAAMIHTNESKVVAAALADFRPYPDNEFVTRMEGVKKKWQRQSIGRELFRFIECIVRFLIMVDGFVGLNIAGVNEVTIKSCVDHDAPEWQYKMMLGMGYTQDDDSWGEDVEFSKFIGCD